MSGVEATQGSTTESLGYVGLGMMGFPMSRRLLGAGYQVTVWNRSESKAIPLAKAGATLANNPSTVARASSIIFMCLTDASAVEDVVFGPEGLATIPGEWKTGCRFLIDPSRRGPLNRSATADDERHGLD
jgi:3-hydroxyisobutyrate dehydrogenase